MRVRRDIDGTAVPYFDVARNLERARSLLAVAADLLDETGELPQAHDLVRRAKGAIQQRIGGVPDGRD